MPVDEITSDKEAIEWARKGSAHLSRLAHSIEVPHLPKKEIKDYLSGICYLCSRADSEETRQELWPFYQLWEKQLKQLPYSEPMLSYGY
jgi:hypothetical protein